MLSSDLYTLIHSTCELCAYAHTESDHIPLTFRFRFPKENICNAEACYQEQIIEKFVWNSGNGQVFATYMCTDETCAMLDRVIDLIDFDLDEALYLFDSCIKEKAECMKKQIRINKSRKLDEWFDWECKVARKNVRRLLKKFRRSLHSEDCNSFCIARREYKNTLKRKKVDFMLSF